jgi:hypothetical protein
MIDFKVFLNKPVCITRISGSKYSGVLNGIRKEKIHLTELVILTKEKRYKAQSKSDTGRWFNMDSILSVQIKEKNKNDI